MNIPTSSANANGSASSAELLLAFTALLRFLASDGLERFCDIQEMRQLVSHCRSLDTDFWDGDEQLAAVLDFRQALREYERQIDIAEAYSYYPSPKAWDWADRACRGGAPESVSASPEAPIESPPVA